jgi:hypothetical protein
VQAHGRLDLQEAHGGLQLRYICSSRLLRKPDKLGKLEKPAGKQEAGNLTSV